MSSSTTNHFNVVSVGEALVDMFCDSPSGEQWRAAVGGSPLNVAITTGRLIGASQHTIISFIGVLSKDRLGSLIRRTATSSNVNLDKCPIGIKMNIFYFQKWYSLLILGCFV